MTDRPQIDEGFVECMRSIPGLDAHALIDALEREPSVSIRLNRRKIPTEDGTPLYEDMEAVSWCKDGYYLQRRPIFTLNPLLHAGAFYVQDASSMIYQQIVENLTGSLGNEPIALLDFCAAPGGKTTAMINAIPDGSVVVANEYVPARGKILRENLEKWGYPSVITTGASASDYSDINEAFDIIAIDAPCSGEGMMRKEDEARRQWSQQLVAECAALQKDILQNIAGALRPGGYLIYSTCTFNLEEDELNSLFISETLGLEPVAVETLSLKGIEQASNALLPEIEGLRFMPHLTKGEGLYVSIFRKPGIHEANPLLTSAIPCNITGKRDKKRGKSDNNLSLSEEMLKDLNQWVRADYKFFTETNGTLVTILPETARGILNILRKNGVKITGAGFPAGEIKGRSMIPDSRLALSSAFNPDAFPKAELNEQDALRYLRRDSFTLGEDMPKGYVTVTYRGIPLGLMKNLGNRANNLFPAPWRIRM